ncbi:MAG TPA: 4Fe-4S binding protein [Draconibacterium sp.]|nr:4Fe-4S binding protein [Draconibacterium sp.]
MKGRRFGKRIFQHNEQVTEEYCICPKCGHTAIHVKGRPCRRFLCPVCHIPLARDQNSFHSTKLNTDTVRSKTLKYPKVNTELCTGCGSCIDVCPMEAISLIDGKAFIKEDICTNCRVCENECPVEAIS